MLSKDPTSCFCQIEGFLGDKKLKVGNQRRLKIGKIALNFYCKNCEAYRTFLSGENLFCIGIDDRKVSIDCVLKCSGCIEMVQMWFLLESTENQDIYTRYPDIRILDRKEKLSENVRLHDEKYGVFTEVLEKSRRASRDGLGAGSIIYLRKVLEVITIETANSSNIEYKKHESGNPKNFSDLLKKVDKAHSIIPKEFLNNGAKLFKELSNVIHGNYDEKEALLRYDAFYQLVVGVLDNVSNSKKITEAINKLGIKFGNNNE